MLNASKGLQTEHDWSGLRLDDPWMVEWWLAFNRRQIYFLLTRWDEKGRWGLPVYWCGVRLQLYKRGTVYIRQGNNLSLTSHYTDRSWCTATKVSCFTVWVSILNGTHHANLLIRPICKSSSIISSNKIYPFKGTVEYQSGKALELMNKQKTEHLFSYCCHRVENVVPFC